MAYKTPTAFGLKKLSDWFEKTDFGRPIISEKIYDGGIVASPFKDLPIGGMEIDIEERSGKIPAEEIVDCALIFDNGYIVFSDVIHDYFSARDQIGISDMLSSSWRGKFRKSGNYHHTTDTFGGYMTIVTYNGNEDFKAFIQDNETVILNIARFGKEKISMLRDFVDDVGLGGLPKKV